MHVLRNIDAVVFDFDGVLIDSVDIKTRAFARLFDPHGSAVVEQVVAHHRRHGGVSRYEKLRHYCNQFLNQPISDEELRALASRFAALVVDEVTSAPWVPGAERFLAESSGRVPCFVVSGTPQDELREIVRRRGMNRYFKDVLGTPASKTDNVRYLLEQHRLLPQQVMLFGDADADREAAAATGVVFVGVITGVQNPLAGCDGFMKIADFEGMHLP